MDHAQERLRCAAQDREHLRHRVRPRDRGRRGRAEGHSTQAGVLGRAGRVARRASDQRKEPPCWRSARQGRRGGDRALWFRRELRGLRRGRKPYGRLHAPPHVRQRKRRQELRGRRPRQGEVGARGRRRRALEQLRLCRLRRRGEAACALQRDACRAAEAHEPRRCLRGCGRDRLHGAGRAFGRCDRGERRGCR